MSEPAVPDARVLGDELVPPVGSVRSGIAVLVEDPERVSAAEFGVPLEFVLVRSSAYALKVVATANASAMDFQVCIVSSVVSFLAPSAGPRDLNRAHRKLQWTCHRVAGWRHFIGVAPRASKSLILSGLASGYMWG